MINILPLTIESLVAILLLLTILYCVRLNNHLKRFKSDETSMQATIAQLVTAVDAAERAIAGLKATVGEADETLGASLKTAERFNAELHRNTAAGADVLQRLSQIAEARPWLLGAQPPVEPANATKPSPPDPAAIVAAAQALSERALARTRLRAAAA